MKERLSHAEMDIGYDLVRRYPKTAALGMFALGIAAGRFPIVRRTLWAAGIWTAQRMMRERFRER